MKTLGLLSITLMSSTLLNGQTAAQPQPPVAKKIHKETKIHGQVLPDDYGWLREKANPEVAAYLEAVLEDGDPRAMPVALRTIAEAMGGLAVLAERTGLSRETLYRTLSEKGNPRYDTLTSILGAFGLRVSVAPQRRLRGTTKHRRVA